MVQARNMIGRTERVAAKTAAGDFVCLKSTGKTTSTKTTTKTV